MKLIPKHQKGTVIVEALDYPTWPSYSPHAYKRILDLNGKPIQIFGNYPDALIKADRDHWAQVAYDLYPNGNLVDIDKVNEEVDKRKRNYASYVALKQKEWSYPSSTIGYEPDWRKRARNRRLALRQKDNLIVYDDYTKKWRDVDGYDVLNGIGDIFYGNGYVALSHGDNLSPKTYNRIVHSIFVPDLGHWVSNDPRKLSAFNTAVGLATYGTGYAAFPYPQFLTLIPMSVSSIAGMVNEVAKGISRGDKINKTMGEYIKEEK